MIRVTDLFESALVRIERIDHPAGAPHVDPRDETAEGYSINFLEAGRFGVTVGGRHWDVGASDVFFTTPGQVQTFAHDEQHEAPADVCVAVCFTPAVHDEVDGRFAALGRQAPVSRLTNRRAYLRHRLLDHLSRPFDPLAIDTLAGELLDASLESDDGRRF